MTASDVVPITYPNRHQLSNFTLSSSVDTFQAIRVSVQGLSENSWCVAWYASNYTISQAGNKCMTQLQEKMSYSTVSLIILSTALQQSALITGQETPSTLLQDSSFVFYFASFTFCWNTKNYGICPFCHMVQSKYILFGNIIVSTDQLIPMLTHCLAGLV